MKFTEGFWMTSERAKISYASDAHYVTEIPGGMRILCPCRKINGRGDVLNLPTITLEFRAVGKNTIAVSASHYLAYESHEARYELTEETVEYATEFDEDAAYLSTGDVTVVVDRKNFSYSFMVNGEVITSCGFRNLAYVQYDRPTSTMLPGKNYFTENGDPYMVNQLSVAPGEYIYGLGERFTPFVKNGQSVETWNEDGGTASQVSYKCIPFYMSNRGYGIFVDNTDNVEFEVCSEKVENVSFSVPGEQMRYYFMYGPKPAEVIENFTALTGRPALPPAWSFGLWLTTSFTTSYDEATVTSFIDGMAERNIPLRVFHFDCYWMKEFQWCDFEWDERVFPDVEGMLKRYHDKGLKLCAWINPYIAQNSEFFREGVEKGYLVMRADGHGVKQVDEWVAGMGLVDFTNPAATKWYTDKLKTILDMGIDCFKTDFGERIPLDVKYYDGSDPKTMHNYYTYLYNKAVFDLLKEVKGENEACLFARSATATCQQFPVHWGGDCSASYPSMAETLRGGLSFAMSGFSFWSHDISGFEYTAPADLYKRWVAFGLLSSHSRLHGSTSYRVPWLFDEESNDVVRHFTKLKCSLMPYIYAKAVEAHEKGTPVMRPMVFAYPNDYACTYLDMQYMLGESLLVAPIFNDKGTVTYYLPEGKWTHLLSEKIKVGGKYYTDTYDYFSLGLYVAPNTILAMGGDVEVPDYEYEKNVELHIYELSNGASATCEIVNMAGEHVSTVTAIRRGKVISVSMTKDLPGAKIILHSEEKCTIERE